MQEHRNARCQEMCIPKLKLRVAGELCARSSQHARIYNFIHNARLHFHVYSCAGRSVTFVALQHERRIYEYSPAARFFDATKEPRKPVSQRELAVLYPLPSFLFFHGKIHEKPRTIADVNFNLRDHCCSIDRLLTLRATVTKKNKNEKRKRERERGSRRNRVTYSRLTSTATSLKLHQLQEQRRTVGHGTKEMEKNA